MLRLISIFLFLFIALSVAPLMKGQDYVVKKLSVEDGLSQSSVTSILRDSRGFLWIGTRHGLNRYDYNSITQYFAGNDDNSIADNGILDIFEGHHGDIWIVTENGLTSYSPATDTFRQQKYNGKRVRTRGLYFFDDCMVFQAEGGNILKYSYATDSIERLPIDCVPGDKGIKILPWNDNMLIIVTSRSGLLSLDLKKMTLDKLDFGKDIKVQTANIDTRGRLWVSPFAGKILCFEKNGKLWREFSERDGLTYDMVTCMVSDTERMYVGGERGIDVIDLETGSIENNPFNGVAHHMGAIASLYISQNHNIYIGTVRNGLRILQSATMRTFQLNPPESLERTVTSMVDDFNDNVLWCGIDGNGIVRLDQNTDKWSVCESTAGLKVIGMANWPGNKLLFSTYGEPLRLMDKTTGKLSPVPAYMNRISEASWRTHIAISLRNLDDGTILALSDSVYSINPAEGTMKVVTSADDEELKIRGKIYFIHSSPKRILVFWYRTVYEIDPKTLKIKPILKTPTGDQIKAAQFDGKEMIYFATSDNLYRHNFRTEETTEMNFEAITNIGSMILDGKKLWVGASNRLFMIEGDKLFSFEEGDGVVPNEFLPLAVLSDSNNLYFGGTNGMVRVNRALTDTKMRTSGENYYLKINLAQVIVNGRSAWNSIHDGVLEIPADGASINIKVVCDEPTPLRSKMFRFYLYGLGHERPYETLLPSLSVSDLPPGRTIDVAVSYTLPDGSWSTPAHMLTLKVQQLWWQRWWFITLVVIAAIAVILGVVRIVRQRWRNASNRHRQHVLEREVQILANVNEGLRVPLDKVATPINEALMLLDSEAKVDQEALAGQLDKALQSIDRMRNMIDSPFEMLHPQSLRIDPIMLTARFNVWLEQQVNANLKAQRLYRRVSVDFKPDYDPGMITFDATRTEMIIGCVMTELTGKAVTHLEILVESDDRERLRVTFRNGDQGAKSGTIDDDAGSLRLMYARWLAERGKITISTTFDSDGNLTQVDMCLPQHFNVSQDTADGFDDTVDRDDDSGLDRRDLSECVLGVACCDAATAEFIKSRSASRFSEVVVCQRGADPVRWLRNVSADVVVVDGNHAGMELCKHLRSSDDFAEVRVVVLTSGNINELKVQSYRYGGDAYLEKPFDINVLFKMCTALVNE